MQTYSARPTMHDKAKAIAGVFFVYALFIAAALMMPNNSPQQIGDNEPTVLINIREIPEPQPPAPEEPGKAELEEGAAGKKAEPTPIVAPKPLIRLPTKPKVVAAPVAGTGSAPTAGAAATGTGPGAGGSGTGRGGGGAGGDGGMGAQARLLGGNSSRLAASLLRDFPADHGYGRLWLTVADNGRVTDCKVLESTGVNRVDAALCGLMVRRSRWEPARDRRGNPITVQVRYTATWKKY